MTDVKVLEEIPETTELELVVINKTVGSLNTNISRLEEMVDERLKDYSPEKYKGDARLQKKFTVDFRTKKRKINEGELPQYYVTGGHPPIIAPETWDAVQQISLPEGQRLTRR